MLRLGVLRLLRPNQLISRLPAIYRLSGRQLAHEPTVRIEPKQYRLEFTCTAEVNGGKDLNYTN